MDGKKVLLPVTGSSSVPTFQSLSSTPLISGPTPVNMAPQFGCEKRGREENRGKKQYMIRHRANAERTTCTTESKRQRIDKWLLEERKSQGQKEGEGREKRNGKENKKRDRVCVREG